MYILAHSVFRLFIPTYNKLGNSTHANIDGAHGRTLLILMQLLHFREALRLGRGSRSVQCIPLIFFWKGRLHFSILWDENQTILGGKLQRMRFVLFWKKFVGLWDLDARGVRRRVIVG
jgi:hypothetical protein